MANHKSAQKSIKQIATRTLRNKSNISAIRTIVKKVEAAIAAGNKEEAGKLFVAAQSKLAKGSTKKIIKANTASRKTKRLAAKVKAMAS